LTAAGNYYNYITYTATATFWLVVSSWKLGVRG
jgi:hypothetical protein